MNIFRNMAGSDKIEAIIDLVWRDNIAPECPEGNNSA